MFCTIIPSKRFGGENASSKFVPSAYRILSLIFVVDCVVYLKSSTNTSMSTRPLIKITKAHTKTGTSTSKIVWTGCRIWMIQFFHVNSRNLSHADAVVLRNKKHNHETVNHMAIDCCKNLRTVMHFSSTDSETQNFYVLKLSSYQWLTGSFFLFQYKAIQKNAEIAQ